MPRGEHLEFPAYAHSLITVPALFSLYTAEFKQSYLINLFFVQVKNLTRTCWGNFFIDLVTNVIPVITVSSQHKYYLY